MNLLKFQVGFHGFIAFSFLAVVLRMSKEAPEEN
jgi:hypothetical protein